MDTAPKKILIIEDDSDIRMSLRQILELEEMNAIVADNGQQGLDQLNTHSDVQVVLLDMMMPIMDGWEFLKRMRSNEKWAHIPVIAISAAGLKASSVNANVFLKKPLDLDLLLDTIRRLCD